MTDPRLEAWRSAYREWMLVDGQARSLRLRASVGRNPKRRPVGNASLEGTLEAKRQAMDASLRVALGDRTQAAVRMSVAVAAGPDGLFSWELLAVVPQAPVLILGRSARGYASRALARRAGNLAVPPLPPLARAS